jgi:hypothetical protein
MYNPEEILIVGDSFCGHRELPTDWPVYLTKLLTSQNASPRGKGYGGCSWWTTRAELKKELAKAPFKVLVVCHTEPHRIWSDFNRPLNFTSVERNFNLQSVTGPDPTNTDTLNAAASLYYKHLYSSTFHYWANEAWFRELDDIIQQNNIEKAVHLHCFKFGADKLHIFNKGVTVTNVLFDYAIDKIPKEGLNPEISNHFTHDFNVKFAEELYKVITSNINNTTTTLTL